MDNITTLILWSEQFEEQVAVALVASLRQAGMTAILVGVTARCCVGRQGITIHPDRTLSSVLDCDVPIDCIAFPCTTSALLRVEHDPRLQRLWERTLQAGAHLLVDHPRTIIETQLRHVMHLAKDIQYYGTCPNPSAMAESLVATLRLRSCP